MATGISPYLAVHGREPTSPVQVLYEGWRKDELKEFDVASWVQENAEHVSTLRDSVTLHQALFQERGKTSKISGRLRGS